MMSATNNITSLINQTDTSEPNKEEVSTMNKRFRFSIPRFPHFSRRTKIILVLLLTPIFLLLVAGLASLPPLLSIRSSAVAAEISARNTYQSLKGQNLPEAKTHLAATRQEIEAIDKAYSWLAWYQFTPLRWHYQDGRHLINSAYAGIDSGDILIASLEPYADVLGFQGDGTFTGGTAEERILKIIETVGEITPKLQEVETKLEVIHNNLAEIDPGRYPFTVRGRSVSELITTGQEFALDAQTLLGDAIPLLEQLPNIAGAQEEKKYLVIFQNDAEIRPTGGFMTAYGIIRVDKGRVFQEKSDDIYQLDQKFNSRLPAPEPIRRYLPLVNYWFLRDMNLSPDFKESMEMFMTYYGQIPSEPDDIDGIIAMDTNVLTNLVRILGPIEVPGFGRFSADIDPRCDCPQVIYELEDYSTRPVAYVRDDRKAFLVPMMQTLIAQAYGAPPQTWPNLFETVYNDIRQKHVLFYFFDEAAQAASERANFAGRLLTSPGDYLLIVDTNFGGAKSDLFIEQDIDHQVTTTDSGTRNELTVTYKNPAPASNCNLEAGQLCLNGTYRDWVRFYLPEGSNLEESLGFEADSVKTSSELGKTVIEGFFTFQPQSQAKLKLTYTTPYVPQDTYHSIVQKQAGRDAPKYTLNLNQQHQLELDLTTDRVIELEL